MKGKILTYDGLNRLLTGFGFVRGHTPQNYQVFTHEPSDTIILLPAAQPDDIVDALHRAAVRRMVIERGGVDEDVYDEALDGVLKSTVLSGA